MGEAAVGEDLGAEGGGFELVAEGGEGAVVFGVEAGARGSLEEPGGSVVVLLVAGDAGETSGVEPVEVGGEPLFEGCEVGCREGFGVGEEGNGLHDFGEVDGFDEALGAACFGGGSGLGVGHARGHAGGGVNEPGFEMGDGLLGVAFFAGEDEGRGEGGNVEAEIEEGVAVGGEGRRVGIAGLLVSRFGFGLGF